MCINAASMPKPFGEYDLKGNPKLPEYCKCFSQAFEARAMKAMTAMQARRQAAIAGTVEQGRAGIAQCVSQENWLAAGG
ncbi:hypothetical protein LP420_17250 [Massilia sp. B-10]|nr:hypothetical protein LP420_17250 [Massilia sp. B-10]UUZ56594.1 hypothetical protein LP419_16705 [Massilia sp. H-1]